MRTLRYVYWKHEDMWLGYPEEFPDYRTQAETLEELQENLKDLYEELTSGTIPEVRRVAELQLS
jgi:predicted RNase H-like HicB family nuclease